MIWISAPAGSGKTTLASSYLSERNLESIWYRVDEGDGDIATFFYYMGLALKKTKGNADATLPLFTPEYLLGITTFTLRYFENLYRDLKPPFAIILDNYQHVQSQSQFHEVVSKGLDITPEGINIIVISREEPPPPFARLRANGKIAFMKNEDVSFDQEECLELIRLKGGGQLTESRARRIYQRTRGWAAGLVLMAESMAEDNFPEETLSGHSRQEIFDYFATEIFCKANSEVQEFLMETSFLPWMTVRMAERLTGNEHPEQILVTLLRKHFFIERDSEPDHPIYRYHPLFSEFLISRAKGTLTPERIARIQQTAAELFMEAGHLDEAVSFLLDAGDWNTFIPFLLDHAPALMAQGRVKTLGDWLESVPRSLVEDSPWLLYWFGHCAFVVAPAEARTFWEKAFDLFNGCGDDTGALFTWACIANTFTYDFDNFKPLDRWIDWMNERIGRDESFPSPEIESAVASSMIGALIWRRPVYSEIRQWIARALSSSRASGNSGVRLLALRRALLHYVYVGDRPACLAVLNETGRIIKSRSAPLIDLIAARMIKAHYHSWIGDDAERALELVEEGFAMAEKNGIHVVDSFLAVQGAFAALNKGDDTALLRFVEKLEAILQAGRRYAVFYHFILALRSLFLEKHAEAEAHALNMLQLSEDSGLPFPEARARTLLSQAAYEIGDQERAEKELAASELFYRQAESPYFLFSTGLIRAYFLFKQGLKTPGLEILGETLQLGRKNGYTFSIMLLRSSVWSLLCAKAMGAGIEIDYVRELINRRKLSPPLPTAEYECWPWPVKIYTLGRFEILLDGEHLGFSGKAPRRLLSFLKVLVAFGTKGTSEDRLADVLWPDSDGDAAHVSFSVTLHRLRRLLGNEQALQLRDGRLRLDPAICWVDALAFEELLASADRETPSQSGRLMEEALKLYQGQFLPGHDEWWAISYRERLHTMYRQGLRCHGRLQEDTGRFRTVVPDEEGLDIDPPD
ncbi:MAG: hypothetical protein R2940_15720 [Syntrophotaleaceae bacterium]